MLLSTLKSIWRKFWRRLRNNPTASARKSVKPTCSPSSPIAGAPSSRRIADMSAEGQLAIFLDEYLYNHFPNRDAFKEIERIQDKDYQLRGVDVRLVDQNDRIYNIDEKAQLYYINKGLPTFAFELEFLRNGIPTTGWLCNDSLLTDFYLLIWPYASQDSPKDICWYQFEKAECLLVQKKKLLAMLLELGLSQERLMDDAQRIRAEHVPGKHTIPGISEAYYYASSPHSYREAPINLVIRKTLLARIATKAYVVTRDGVVCR